ncbi:MAG TPA: MraY family glycosyltransferase [bacterium]|nr:MraY family glycosyltransferase [bacterium]
MMPWLPRTYWEIAVLSFLVAVVTTPVWIVLAKALGAVDRPVARKVHDRPIPYLGGLAFHASYAAVFLYVIYQCPFLLESPAWLQKWVVLFVGGTFILLVGIYDDLRGMAPKWKLLAQVLVALFLVAFGFRFELVTNPFGGGQVSLGAAGWILSVFWIVGIANAINLVDGLDGLAAGVVFFAACANLAIALSPWQGFVSLISLILVGTTLGFLPYNFHPAKIFMGDAGALYLGFLLGASAIENSVKSTTVVSLLFPLVALLLPILDTGLAVIRRSRRGQHPFAPDREHIHHRLLQLGLSHRHAVLLLHGLCLLLAVSAYLGSRLPNHLTILFLTVFGGTVMWGFWVFAYLDRRIAQLTSSPDSDGPLVSEHEKP